MNSGESATGLQRMPPRLRLRNQLLCQRFFPGICLPVKLLLQIFGLVLALAWVPITSHCSWESVVGGDFFKCAPATEKSDCANETDGCVTLESASYKVPETAPVLTTPLFVVVLFQHLVLTAKPFGQITPDTAAPSEIPVRWQFAFRTALPPRAPSFVS